MKLSPPLPVFSRDRFLPAAILSALLFAATGCHHKPPRVAQQPPPPPASSQEPEANRAPGSSGNIPSEARGRPISSETGLASWYGPPYHGRKAADGSVYNQNAMTAAHLTLPLGTLVRVTNLATHQSAFVRITDRGPFVRGRIIDLSLAAAKAVGVYRPGVARVRVEAYASADPPPPGHWCVQVGAFSSHKDAVKLKERLSRRYTTANVIEFAGPTGYWVRLTPRQPNHSNAIEVADSIRPSDPDAHPYLVRTN